MKITDLEIGQFATRNWNTSSDKSLCDKRYNLNLSEYWENEQLSLVSRDNSSIFKKTDFELCDCNGKLLEKESIYPLFMESIQNGTVIKFVSLHSGMVIIQGKANDKPGHEYPARVKHNDYRIWKPCDFSKAPEIEDLDYWDARYNAGLPVYFTLDSGTNKTCYKANLLPSVLFKDNNNIKFHISDLSKSKFTYPMYFESIENDKNKQFIVKFTNNRTGEIVKVSKQSTRKVGYVSSAWVSHNNTEDWKQVNFDEKLNKIIPTNDDIDELISDLKSIIEDSDSRFNPSECGAGTQLSESAYEYCHDLIDEWYENYHIDKTPDIDDEENFKYFNDLVDVIMYIENLLHETNHKPIGIKGNMTTKEKKEKPIEALFGQNPFDKYYIPGKQSPCCLGIDYASESDVSFVPINKLSKRIYNDDTLDALSYAISQWNHKTTGATEVANNLNKSKEFTMNNELKQAILELIAESKQLKAKKPKTPKIVCNVEGTLIAFADEAALKQFMWSSRVESVIRYDLSGKVTVPFELSVEAPKTKASK